MDTSIFSNEQIVGQRLVVGFDGLKINNELKFLIDKIKVGGIILFSRNISSPEQIKKLCLSVQKYANKCRQPPLLIAVDQEGGKVARLKKPFTVFAGNSEMKEIKDAVYFAQVTASELSEVGINMNMAPVLDVVPGDQKTSIMTDRSFSCDPGRVSDFGTAVIKTLQQNKIMSVAKHFPGIGRTIQDSHLNMPVIKEDIDVLRKSDFLPFESAIKHEVAGIMLSHILYKSIDSKWPASLSVNIAKKLLRKHMGYKGVVMTDDLDMGAIEKNYGFTSSINQIMIADVDIALICKNSPKIECAFDIMLNRMESDRNMRSKSLASAKRIMMLKKKYLEFD